MPKPSPKGPETMQEEAERVKQSEEKETTKNTGSCKHNRTNAHEFTRFAACIGPAHSQVRWNSSTERGSGHELSPTGDQAKENLVFSNCVSLDIHNTLKPSS